VPEKSLRGKIVLFSKSIKGASGKGLCAGAMTVVFLGPFLVFFSLVLLLSFVLLAGIISAIQEGIWLYRRECRYCGRKVRGFSSISRCRNCKNPVSVENGVAL
jgi:hypothetical protein